MRNRNLIVLLILTLRVTLAIGQTDSTVVNFDTFMEMVRSNHPVARQGEILLETGEVNLKKSRGNFDPELKSVYDQKQFDGKNYYQLNTNELKIPTPLGLQLKAGYDNNRGTYVNPENKSPDNGLAYAGVAIPLGKGLLFDERRQEVRQAEVYKDATVLERALLINQLVYDAAKAYWDWQASWNAYETYEQALRLAEVRYEGIRSSFLQGDVPAIDTLEAYILVQNRQLSLNEAAIRLQQAKLEASNYLWSENLDPMELTPGTIPVERVAIEHPFDEAWLAGVLAIVDQQHPKLRLYENKLENLDFERRMKAEKVKPKLNLNYNVLSQPVGGNPFESYSSNDYKWGFEFSMPLLLRKERGDLQLTKLKMSQTDLDRQNESLKIKNKIKAYHVEINNLYGQIRFYEETVRNYLAMLNGEKRKFEEGESSLFVVNSRENSLITAEVKLIELIAKYQKSLAALEMAIGGDAINI